MGVGPAGDAPELDSQKAETWSIGFEIEPPILPGLQVNATYYAIEFEDALGRPPVFDANLFFSNPGYQQFYVLNPQEQIAAAAASTSNRKGRTCCCKRVLRLPLRSSISAPQT